jgi:NADH-quinone oxidoreductase subunit J
MIGLASAASAAGLISGQLAGLSLGPVALLAQAGNQAVTVQQVPAGSLHPSMAPPWAFWVLATLTVVGALSTILRRNLIGAVMSMVATFFGLASLYALLSAHFLAAIQVLVYAGAIMVLFVFVIMVLNREEADPWPTQGIVGKALGAGALVYLAMRLGGMLLAPGAAIRSMPGDPKFDYGTVSKLGEFFFTDFLFPFEAISILLVIAVIGAVVLAKSHVSRPTSTHEAGVDGQRSFADAHESAPEDAAPADAAGHSSHGHGGH